MSRKSGSGSSKADAPRVRSSKTPEIGRVQDMQQQTKSEEANKVTLNEVDVNKLISKGFRVEKALSAGSCGQLFLMTYKPPEKENEGNRVYKMAVKVVDKSTVEESLIKKFLPREIEILAEVDNPYCISVYAMMEMNEKAYLFMRYAENGDLLDYIHKNGALSENHGRLWMRQLFLAVDYLDRLGIAHRDIKLENILVTENLNLKLADFGFARKYLDDDGKELQCETYCGSLSYAAPEILEGKPMCPKKVDVWSSGVVMFIVFNLEKPFKRKGAQQILLAQQSRAYKWTQTGTHRVSEDCRKLVEAILEPVVSRRPRAGQILQRSWMMEDPEIVRFAPEPSIQA